jgi:hypothetical protein
MEIINVPQLTAAYRCMKLQRDLPDSPDKRDPQTGAVSMLLKIRPNLAREIIQSPDEQ